MAMLFPSTKIPQELQVLSCFLLDQLPTLPRSLQPLLLNHLLIRYLPNHWYPQQSERGSGFRAVSFEPTRHDGYLDPVLRLIASDARISSKELKKSLSPQIGWTVWCDPGCVSVRYHAGGGELRELWGSLPPRLAPTVVSPHAPSTGLNFSPQLSPCKSRAIPILAPASIRVPSDMGLAVTPPTPLPEQPDVPAKAQDESDDVDAARHMNRPFSFRPSHSRQASKHSAGDCTDFYSNNGAQLTPIIPGDDPFLRPDSRTSSASSSSCSDHSAFSALTASTTSTVPLTGHRSRKTSTSATPPVPILDQIYVRHSANSLSYALSAAQAPPFQPSPHVFPGQGAAGRMAHAQSMVSRSSSPARVHGGRRLRERHYSTSVSSVASNGISARHGGLVLKEGPGTVTEHSGGKVGVMGGGVLLGLPKTEGCNTDKKTARGGRRGRASQNQFSLSGLAHFM